MSATPTARPEGCEHCNRASLSLLLLRPSPIARSGPLAPREAAAVVDAGALVQGLLPARAPTESRTVLRLLRAGFVHVYLPKPPPGIKPWLVYQVTEHADLIPQSNPAFNPQSPPVSCARKGHNAAGMRLLTLPQAHKLGTVWIAYSANLWNEALRARNAANPKVMQQLQLGSPPARSFKPEAGRLRAHVLECALMRRSLNGSEDAEFPFNSLAMHAEALADELKRAAAAHPKTAGQELALVLPDPVGYAAELNELRLRRHEVAKAEMAKPENLHALNSIHLAKGLRQQLIDSESITSYAAVAPLRTRAKFASETWPEGTQWQPLTPQDRDLLLKSTEGNAIKRWLLSDYRTAFERQDLGRVIYADHNERVAAWAREQADKTWSKIADEYVDAEREQWQQAFEQHMKTQHFDPLLRMERDWWSACQDAEMRGVFERHFDDADPNAPLQAHSPGHVYTREVACATTPAPFSPGALQSDYETELMADATQPSAVMLRALVANQGELIVKLKALLDAEQGAADAAEYLHSARNDKLYDIGSYLSQNGPLARHSWGSASLAAMTAGYSLWISQSLLAVVVGPLAKSAGTLATATAMGAQQAASHNALLRLARARAAMLVQQALTMAMQSVAEGQGPRTPVLLTRDIRIGTLMRLIAGDASASARAMSEQLERLQQRQASVRVSVLTDNHTLAQKGGDLKDIIRANPAAAAVGKGAREALASQAPAATTALSQAQFNELLRAQAGAGQRAARALRDTLQGGQAAVTSLGGVLALGTIAINAVGLISSLATIRDSKDAQQVRYAWYGLADSAAGVLGGLFEVMAVGATAQALARAPAGTSATTAAAHSTRLTVLRVAGASMGAVAGVANWLANWAKAADARDEGDHDVAQLYRRSGLAFLGTTVTSLGYGAGVAANRLAQRGVGGTVVRVISMRLGTTAAAAAFSGVGALLLGAGLAFEVWAVMAKPGPMEQWARRTRFGKLRGERYATWKDEEAALQAIFSPQADEAATPEEDPTRPTLRVAP